MASRPSRRLRWARVRTVAGREWTVNVRNRTFLVVSVVVPALMVGLATLPGYLVQQRSGLPLPSAEELLANRYMVGVMLVVFLFLGVTTQAQALLRSVMEERATRMVEVLLSSIAPLELLLGKILGYAAVALTQLAVWATGAAMLSRALGLPAPGSALATAGARTLAIFAACYAVGYLLYASLYAAAAAVIAAEREAVLWQQLLSLTLVAPFVVTISLAASPDDPLLAELVWIPFMAPTLLLLRSAFGTLALYEVVGPLLVAALTALAVLAGAARLFTAATLVSTRRLSWRDWRTAGGGKREAGRGKRGATVAGQGGEAGTDR